MASPRTDHTGTTGQGVPLGAPGTTGAFETHDPLGAPGSTGAYPTNPATPTAVPYDTGGGQGGQEQLHRPTGGVEADVHMPLHKEHGVGNTGTTQRYAHGSAATTEPAGQHASVKDPHQTTDTTGLFGGGYDKSNIGRTGATSGGKTHVVGGGHGGAGGGYDIGRTAVTTGQRGYGGGGGYNTGGDKTHGQRVGEHGGGSDTGTYKKTDIGHTGMTTGDKELHRTVGGHGGGGYDTRGDKTHAVGHGNTGQGGTGVVHMEARVYVQGDSDKDKGIMERIKEPLPETGDGTKPVLLSVADYLMF